MNQIINKLTLFVLVIAMVFLTTTTPSFAAEQARPAV